MRAGKADACAYERMMAKNHFIMSFPTPSAPTPSLSRSRSSKMKGNVRKTNNFYIPLVSSPLVPSLLLFCTAPPSARSGKIFMDVK